MTPENYRKFKERMAREWAEATPKTLTLGPALLAVLELAEQNVIDDPDYQKEHRKQLEAISLVTEMLFDMFSTE